jgi:CRISPR/Cas system-associated exonuclease Cas4 (RecB family)
VIQVAIKTELGVFYFNQPFPVQAAFTEDGKLADQEFLQQWKAVPDANESQQAVANRTAQTVDDIKARLAQFNLFYVASRTVNKVTNSQAIYFSAKLKGQPILAEVKIEGNSTQVSVRAQDTTYSALALQAIASMMQ